MLMRLSCCEGKGLEIGGRRRKEQKKTAKDEEYAASVGFGKSYEAKVYLIGGEDHILRKKSVII